MPASSSSVRSSLWFIPVMCVIAGVVLSVVTNTVDRALDFDVIPRWLTGGPEAASGILQAIATSMVSLAALVLTVTMVVVQLAMGQFSPRIVQTFLQDRPSQLAIGLFVATFAHAMLSMREVQYSPEEQVPGIAIAVAFALVITSIAMLVLYVDHIGRSLRVSALIELVGGRTRQLLDREYPHTAPATAASDVVAATQSGVVVGIDRDRLAELAVGADCVLHVVPAMGQFVPAGAPLVRVDGDADRLDTDEVLDCLRSGLERTLDGDVAYGFRLLVDMAERSLSESPFMDPTTAVQCIDRLHDGLRQLGPRTIPDGSIRVDGVVRVTVPTATWDDFVHLVFDEIRLVGACSPQVSRRLTAALDDLLTVVPPERAEVLVEQRRLLHDAARQCADRASEDSAIAIDADPTGIGHVTRS